MTWVVSLSSLSLWKTSGPSRRVRESAFMKMASSRSRDHAGSVPIHETDLQLAYRIEQYQAARDRRQCCLNDIEREGRVATRLGECTLKLEELYQEARLAVRDAAS